MQVEWCRGAQNHLLGRASHHDLSRANGLHGPAGLYFAADLHEGRSSATAAQNGKRHAVTLNEPEQTAFESRRRGHLRRRKRRFGAPA